MILEHPDVIEIAVVGVDDLKWGERVCLIGAFSREITVDQLRDWAKEKMAEYKIPSKIVRVPKLSRNQMGKINKKQLKETLKL